ADEAEARIDALRRFLRASPDNPMQLINLYGARIVALVERGRTDQPFEQLTAEFAALGLKAKSMVPEQRVYYIFEALGRLARLRVATEEHRAAERAAAEAAVAGLGKVADT